MSEGSSRADDAHTEAADEVREANDQADGEDAVAGELSHLVRPDTVVDVTHADFIYHDDCDDETVDGDGLAENNRDEVLGHDTLHLDG